MSNTIKLKRGSGSDPSASDLVVGEVALRTDSGKLFTKKDDDSVAEIGGGSGAIDDGAITNAKVASDAAIAGSKISPDFGSQNIVTSGTIKTTGNQITIEGVAPVLTFTETNDNPDFQISGNGGALTFKDTTNNAERLKINTDGHVDVLGNLDVGAGLDVTDGDITLASGHTVDGRDVSADGSKLDGIESNATADQSNSEIKTAYEANSDTNAFTDALLSKLNGIASSATNVTNNNQLTNGAGYITSSSDITGNAESADHIDVSGVTTNSALQVVFSTNNSGSNRTLAVDSTDSKFTYNPSSNTLSVDNIDVDNDLSIADNGKAIFGDGSDLQIYHDGTNGNSHINESGSGSLVIKATNTYINSSADEAMIAANADGSVELYYDNSKKLHTHSGGITISGSIHMDDNNKYIAGSSDDLQIYHDGSNSYINDSGTGDLIIKTNIFRVRGTNDEAILTGAENGNVSLYYDNSKKFGTDSGGAQVFGVLRFDDGSSSTNQINFGNSADLKIYHDGSDSRIEDTGTGGLYLSSNSFVVLNAAKNEYQIQGTENAGVQLYYNGSEHFKTSSVGVTVTGNIAVGDGNGIDFSATGNGSGTSNVAELLDDYEEGNWSPELKGGNAFAGNHSMQQGSYTKVGRKVTISFGVAITSKGNMSGDLHIVNLPFGVASNLSGTSIEASGIAGYWKHVSPNLSHITCVADDADAIYLRATSGAEDDPDQLTHSDIDSDFTIRGTVTYFTS